MSGPDLFEVVHGDALDVLRALPAASVDSIVTDPPAGIAFMGRDWDSDRGGRREWIAWAGAIFEEARRVLKPGGHALVWALPKTSHWTATAVEDAGFEIRDVVVHLQGQGFPKSLDVSKAIDKAAGAERERLGTVRMRDIRNGQGVPRHANMQASERDGATYVEHAIPAPATDDAARWSGWGTALKPAAEHWILARAPLARRTVAANVVAHGTGALNIDGCRIGYGGKSLEDVRREAGSPGVKSAQQNVYNPIAYEDGRRVEFNAGGRWPANVVLSHDERCEALGARRILGNGIKPGTGTGGRGVGFGGEDRGKRAGVQRYGDADGLETVEAYRCVEWCAVAQLDAQSGERASGANPTRRRAPKFQRTFGAFDGASETPARGADRGGVSRFLYVAKPSAGERDAGLAKGENDHPTVKSIALGRWLCRLVTPPGGLVLDMFAGSGSLGCAAVVEGFRYLGIERDAQYVARATRRIEHWARHGRQLGFDELAGVDE